MDEFKEQTRPSTARKPSVKRDEEKRAALHAFGGGLKVLHIPSAALAGLPFTRQLTQSRTRQAKLQIPPDCARSEHQTRLATTVRDGAVRQPSIKVAAAYASVG
jgi:hypothetical protein